jgi:hypothetical protein
LQTFPQVPQLVVLVDRFTHAPLHMAFPETIQAFDAVIAPPPTRVRPDPTEDVVVDVVVPVVVTAAVVVTGAVVTSAGMAVQVEALQVMPDGQAFPHMPQLAELAESS